MDDGIIECCILKIYSANGVWLKLLCLTIIATLLFEHSQLDIHISELFYTNGHWLLEKGTQPFAFIFYDLPKLLLILLGIYLIAVLILRHRQNSDINLVIKNTKYDKLLTPLSTHEISYLLLVLIAVPSMIALLKGVTHVSCPNHLILFGGDLPYLNIWQNIAANTPAKCFPAAHASAGFSLYGLAFLPTLHQYRYRIFEIVTVVGWTMGLYKMLFGDHFFSHTLVSMLLSLTITCVLATLFFKYPVANKANSINANGKKPDAASFQKSSKTQS